MNPEEREEAKEWIRENLRVIVSVFIVAAIALGIYSYSQRPESPEVKSERDICMEKFGDLPYSEKDSISIQCVRYFDL